jgi:alpha-1,3-rhamnosyltransferase
MQSSQQESKKQNEIKVTVVVPSYNHEEYIGQCLNSIINQTLKPSQLLVIDDGSKDNSVKTIEKILQNCPFPYDFYVRENKGLCKTLNEGLEKSTGDFFAYLGSDDIWLPNFLENRTNSLLKNPSGVLAFGHCHIINLNNEVIGNTVDLANYDFPTTREMLLYGFPPSSPTVVYRKKFLEKHQWNPNIKLEDYDLYLRLCAEGDFIFEPTALSAWRIHDFNTSRNNDFMLEETIAAVVRNSDILAISKTELKKIIKTKNAFIVNDYISGKKRLKALKLLIGNFDGFSSKTRALKQFIKILTPMQVHTFYQNLVEQNNKGKHKKLFINESFQIIEV